MIQEPEIIGSWVREKVLGSGAFGIVTLWRNSTTNDKIAIKKYRGEAASSLTSKHKERWTKEVEMMQRINNENIVSFCHLPVEFEHELQKYNLSKLPMLSMEYCEGGDLRSVLSRAENCCGLRESDVRSGLSDLSNAVSHLHSLGITHRDLKPENVVLCPTSEDRRVCKLIDLGYAKEIDAGSVAASLVGTMQYLAPEFFYSRTYSCSVDYWSLGLVSFELACGTRPFLLNMSPAQWMRYVQDKKHEDVCIWQDEDGTIRHCEELWAESHISSWLREALAKWLRLALEFNPKIRGREPTAIDAGPVLFEQLHTVLQQKIISVFCVPMLKFLHYQVDDYTLINTLCGWIERDTKITKKDQILFSTNSNKITADQLVVQYFDKTYTTDPMIYVFKTSEILKDEIHLEIPKLVRNMLENMSAMQYHFQKQSYAHALFFIYRENRLYNTLLDACHIRLSHIESAFAIVRNKCTTMSGNIENLVAQTNFSKDILDFDVAKYLKQFSQDATHWQTSHQKIADEIAQLTEISQKICKRFDSVNRRILVIKDEAENKYSKYSKHILDKRLNEALELYRDLKRKPKEKRFKPESCSNMMKVLYSVLKERSNLLKDKSFALYQQKILDLELELEKMSLPLSTALQHADKRKTELLTDHLTRQAKIWEFTIKPKHIPLVSNNIDHTSTIDIGQSNESESSSNNTDHIQANNDIYQEPVTDKYYVDQPTIATQAPQPEFKIGNVNGVDYGDPISLKTPVHFILGQVDEQPPSHATQTSPIKEEPPSQITNGDSKSSVSAKVVPMFLIGAPTSILINDNQNLRYELQEKTNESFLRCKSILNENLDFSFLYQ